jgi:hypothetical protein
MRFNGIEGQRPAEATAERDISRQRAGSLCRRLGRAAGRAWCTRLRGRGRRAAAPNQEGRQRHCREPIHPRSRHVAPSPSTRRQAIMRQRRAVVSHNGFGLPGEGVGALRNARGGFSRIKSMSHTIRVDPRRASAALRERSHRDDLGSLLVASSCASDLKRQGDEAIGAACRARAPDVPKKHHVCLVNVPHRSLCPADGEPREVQ